MATINGGGPAFPIIAENGLGHIADGMSLRDWFAGQALSGLFAGSFYTPLTLNACADDAYRIADAMLKAREADHG